MTRLGRADQDLDCIGEAIDVFTRAVAVDVSNTIAQRGLTDLRLRRQRVSKGPRATGRDVVLRERAAALKVLDGPWRSDCVALLADLLLFARRE